MTLASKGCNCLLFASIFTAVAVLATSNPAEAPIPVSVKPVKLLAILPAVFESIPWSAKTLAIFISNSVITGAAAATPPEVKALSTVPPPNAPIAVWAATR